MTKNETSCWNCNAFYPAINHCCPKCCASNGMVDLESAQIEAADPAHIDHEWESRDDSFSHEFGTEQILYLECCRCGATKNYE